MDPRGCIGRVALLVAVLAVVACASTSHVSHRQVGRVGPRSFSCDFVYQSKESKKQQIGKVQVLDGVSQLSMIDDKMQFVNCTARMLFDGQEGYYTCDLHAVGFNCSTMTEQAVAWNFVVPLGAKKENSAPCGDSTHDTCDQYVLSSKGGEQHIWLVDQKDQHTRRKLHRTGKELQSSYTVTWFDSHAPSPPPHPTERYRCPPELPMHFNASMWLYRPNGQEPGVVHRDGVMTMSYPEHGVHYRVGPHETVINCNSGLRYDVYHDAGNVAEHWLNTGSLCSVRKYDCYAVPDSYDNDLLARLITTHYASSAKVQLECGRENMQLCYKWDHWEGSHHDRFWWIEEGTNAVLHFISEYDNRRDRHIPYMQTYVDLGDYEFHPKLPLSEFDPPAVCKGAHALR